MIWTSTHNSPSDEIAILHRKHMNELRNGLLGCISLCGWRNPCNTCLDWIIVKTFPFRRQIYCDVLVFVYQAYSDVFKKRTGSFSQCESSQKKKRASWSPTLVNLNDSKCIHDDLCSSLSAINFCWIVFFYFLFFLNVL